ncbi:MAG TPA: DUF1929 domain-containing protein [Fimbriimonadaceae bacterium]|nr:DUF1929 domain-containing protein [Fimbriimonadaceae bacterium]
MDLGTWSEKINWNLTNPTRRGFAIHMSLSPDKRLIIWNWRKPDNVNVGAATEFKVWAVSDATGGSETPYNYKVLTEIPIDISSADHSQIFCSGHTWTYDGKLFAAGGHRMVGTNGQDYGGYGTYLFDPEDDSFPFNGPLTAYPGDTYDPGEFGRWYPTCFQLPNRHIVIMAGTRVKTSPPTVNDYMEIWAPAAGEEDSFIARLDDQEREVDGYYPHTFIHPTNGDLVIAGGEYTEIQSGNEVVTFRGAYKRLDLLSLAFGTPGSSYLVLPPANEIANVRRSYSSSVMIGGIVYRSGGAGTGSDNPATAVPAVKTSLKWNLNLTSGWWSNIADMNVERKNHTLVALPDGKILAMGGNRLFNNSADIEGDIEAATPELYNPSNNSWTAMAVPPEDSLEDPAQIIGRPYHSTSLLLPNAKVIIAGGEQEGVNNNLKQESKRSAHIFSPPYGGRDDWETVRPSKPIILGSGMDTVYYGETLAAKFLTPSGRNGNKVVLLSIGSTTHAFNANQHTYVLYDGENLPLNDFVTLNGPTDPNKCPPGYYMMFAVDTTGIPSEAEMLLVKDLSMFVPRSGQSTQTVGTANNNSERTTPNIRVGDNHYFGTFLTSSIDDTDHAIVVESELTGDETSASTSKLRALVECSASFSGTAPTLTVSVWNYQDFSWNSVDTSAQTMTGTDSNYTFLKSLGGNNSDYLAFINPYYRMKVKLRWARPSGSGSFTVKFDKLEGGSR